MFHHPSQSAGISRWSQKTYQTMAEGIADDTVVECTGAIWKKSESTSVWFCGIGHFQRPVARNRRRHHESDDRKACEIS